MRDRVPPSRARRPLTAAVAAAALTTAAGLIVSTPAGAQGGPPAPTGNAPFPAAIVAAVPAAGPDEGHPELAVTDLYAVESLEREQPQMVVQFAGPFPSPAPPYRVSVIVGDPAGARLRTSFVAATAGVAPTGAVDRYDPAAATWVDEGPTDVQFNAAGFVILSVPLGRAPAGGSVWVEIGGRADQAARTTPAFDRAALFGQAAAGTLPGSTWARVTGADGPPTTDRVLLDDPPVLAAQDGIVVARSSGPLPTALLGQPVAQVVDTVRIAPNYNGGATRTYEVRIDRTAGTLRLLDGRGDPAVDRTGDGQWGKLLTTESEPGSGGGSAPSEVPVPAEPGAVELSIPAIALAVGAPIDPQRAAFGVSRSIRLADGRTVVTDGVLASAGWFDRGRSAPPAAAAPGVTAPGEEPAATPAPADRHALAGFVDKVVGDGFVAALRVRAGEPRVRIGAAAIVGLLLVGIVVAAVRRRRYRRWVQAMVTRGERLPWDPADGALTHAAERKVMAEVLASMPPEVPTIDLRVPPEAALAAFELDLDRHQADLDQLDELDAP